MRLYVGHADERELIILKRQDCDKLWQLQFVLHIDGLFVTSELKYQNCYVLVAQFPVFCERDVG